MNEPILSICIPTFQRCSWIAGLLTQLEKEIKTVPDGQIEVCIIDNASSDGSWDFLIAVSKRNTWLRISRNKVNIGIEGNIIQAMLVGSGRYTWLLSDHQKLRPNVLSETIDILQSLNPDLVCMAMKPWQAPLGKSGVVLRLKNLTTDERSALLFTLGNMSSELIRSELFRENIRLSFQICSYNYPNLAFIRSLKNDFLVVQVHDATVFPSTSTNSALVRSYDPFEASFVNNLKCVASIMSSSEVGWTRRGFQTRNYVHALSVELTKIMASRIRSRRETSQVFLRAAWENRISWVVGVCTLLCLIGSITAWFPYGVRRKTIKYLLSIFAPHSRMLMDLT
jgi:glycosyltransferase involved in cell wall biosynthesis